MDLSWITGVWTALLVVIIQGMYVSCLLKILILTF